MLIPIPTIKSIIATKFIIPSIKSSKFILNIITLIPKLLVIIYYICFSFNS